MIKVRSLEKTSEEKTNKTKENDTNRLTPGDQNT